MTPEPHKPVPDMVALIVKGGREWRITFSDERYYVMDDTGSIAGPFLKRDDAWAFIWRVASPTPSKRSEE